MSDRAWRGNTERRFNDWHYTLPGDWWYIDLDGMEVCARCKAPLLLYETTKNDAKVVTIGARLARRAAVPFVLIVLPPYPDALTDETDVRWSYIDTQRPFDRDWTSATMADWRRCIQRHRLEHTCAP